MDAIQRKSGKFALTLKPPKPSLATLLMRNQGVLIALQFAAMIVAILAKLSAFAVSALFIWKISNGWVWGDGFYAGCALFLMVIAYLASRVALSLKRRKRFY